MKHLWKALSVSFLILIMISSSCLAEETADTVIDYHKCSQLLCDIYGERCVEEARQVIDAFFSGKSQVVLDSYQIGDLPRVEYLAAAMCPIFNGAAFVGWDSFDDETNTFYWTSLCGTEGISRYKEQFESICHSYLDKLEDTDSSLVKYLSLYYDFTSERVYDDNLQEELDACERPEDQSYPSSSLRAMIDKTGTCNMFSSCYTFLCIQAGLNVCDVGDQDSDAGAHEWNIIEIDGKYYYCDTTWDLCDESGYPSLDHFGITAEERSWDGYLPENAAFHVNDPLITPSSLGLDDTRFDWMHSWSFKHITGFTIDHDKNCVTVTNEDGETNVIR